MIIPWNHLLWKRRKYRVSGKRKSTIFICMGQTTVISVIWFWLQCARLLIRLFTGFHRSLYTRRKKNLPDCFITVYWLLYNRTCDNGCSLCDSDVVVLHRNWFHYKKVNLSWFSITGLGSVFDILRSFVGEIFPCIKGLRIFTRHD